jgi:hypothetical protein
MMASCATVRLCRPASSLDFFIFLKKHFAKIYDGLEILQFWHPFVMSHDQRRLHAAYRRGPQQLVFLINERKHTFAMACTVLVPRDNMP